MDTIGLIIVTATFVEAIVNIVKMIWDKEKRSISYSVLLSLAIGIVIALSTNLDILGAFGVVIEWKILPQVISGVIISRGANYVYDLVGKLTSQSKAIL